MSSFPSFQNSRARQFKAQPAPIPDPAQDFPTPQRIKAELRHFQQNLAQFNRGVKQFETEVRAVQAGIREDIGNLRRAVHPIRPLAPITYEPLRRSAAEIAADQEAALTEFLDRGARLWYWTSYGLIVVGTFLLTNALIHPFEPWINAQIDALLGR